GQAAGRGQAHDLAHPLIGLDPHHDGELGRGHALAQRLEHRVAAGDLVAAEALARGLRPAGPTVPTGRGGRGALVLLVVGTVLCLRRRPLALERPTAHTARTDARALLAL